MKKDWMYLEELMLNDEGALINEHGEIVEAVKLSSGQLRQNPRSPFPMEIGEVPNDADSFLLGESKNEIKTIRTLPGIITMYTPSYTQIYYYQIKK